MKNRLKHSYTLQEITFICMIVSCIALYDKKIIFLGTQVIAILALFIKNKIKITAYTKIYVLWGLAFGLFALMSKIWASSINSTLFSTVLSFFQVFIIGLIVQDYYRDTKNKNHVIFGYILGCILLIVRFFIEIPIRSWGLQSRFPKTSIFGGNGPAISLSFAVVILFGFLIKNKETMKASKRIVTVTLICMFVLVSLLIGTRKAIIILLCGIVLIVLFEANTIKMRFRALFVIILILVGAYLLITKVPVIYDSVGYRIDSMLAGLNESGKGDNSFITRDLFISDALNTWKNNPIIGIGQDGYRHVNSIQYGYYSHNNFVEILANLGIVGFLIYYSLFLYLMKKSLNIIKKDYLPFVLVVIVLITDYFRVSYMAENGFVVISIIMILLSSCDDSEKVKA